MGMCLQCHFLEKVEVLQVGSAATKTYGLRSFHDALVSLPLSLKTLTLDEDFNQPLEHVSLPEGKAT